MNAKTGWEFDRFDACPYANNLFDTNYDMHHFFEYYTNYSPPREIGISLNYRF